VNVRLIWLSILRARVPGIAKALSEQVVAFVQALRKEDLFKVPGVAETLDWAGALSELDVVALDPATVSDTLACLLAGSPTINPHVSSTSGAQQRQPTTT